MDVRKFSVVIRNKSLLEMSFRFVVSSFLFRQSSPFVQIENPIVRADAP